MNTCAVQTMRTADNNKLEKNSNFVNWWLCTRQAFIMANKTDETYSVFVRLKNDQGMKTIYNNSTKIKSLSASHRNASLKKMDCNAGCKDHQN